MHLLRFTEVFTIWTKQAFSGIWEVLSYSINWIPWRSILVNINFYVIQFPLIWVFLHEEMKVDLLDICLFLLFLLAKTIPQKASKVLLEFNDKILINLLSFGPLWNTLLGETLPQKIFRNGNMRKFHKNFHHFSTSVFFPINILLFSTSIKMYTVKQ